MHVWQGFTPNSRRAFAISKWNSHFNLCRYFGEIPSCSPKYLQLLHNKAFVFSPHLSSKMLIRRSSMRKRFNWKFMFMTRFPNRFCCVARRSMWIRFRGFAVGICTFSPSAPTRTRLTYAFKRHIIGRRTSGRCRSNGFRNATPAATIVKSRRSQLRAIHWIWTLSVSCAWTNLWFCSSILPLAALQRWVIRPSWKICSLFLYFSLFFVDGEDLAERRMMNRRFFTPYDDFIHSFYDEYQPSYHSSSNGAHNDIYGRMYSDHGELKTANWKMPGMWKHPEMTNRFRSWNNMRGVFCCFNFAVPPSD
jgi:hypothetical protein